MAYLLTVLLALLIVPAITLRYRHGLVWTFVIDFAFFAASTGSVLLFYREGQRWAGRPMPPLRELLAVLPVGLGMSVRNAAAVLEGLFEEGGHFKRTPKRGDLLGRGIERGRALALIVKRPHPWGETLLALFFAFVFVIFARAGRWVSLPFLALFVTGYGYVACLALVERVTSPACDS